MAMPAAREGSLSSSCTINSPPSHGIGVIEVPIKSGVEICNKPAATITSPCSCLGPPVPVPNTINTGSPTVLIGTKGAARVLDTTTHGGFITFASGEATVLIGEYAAAAALTVWPGKQQFGNCAVQCCEQIIHQATGVQQDEDIMLHLAITGQWAISDLANLKRHGGMIPDNMQKLLRYHNVESKVYNSVVSLARITKLVKDNRGIIANLNADTLWQRPQGTHPEGHAVLITEGDFDDQGELTHVYINDTGPGQQGRRVPISLLVRALYAFTDPFGRKQHSLVATKHPIWNRPTPSSQVP